MEAIDPATVRAQSANDHITVMMLLLKGVRPDERSGYFREKELNGKGRCQNLMHEEPASSRVVKQIEIVVQKEMGD